jgi:superfamily II DNA or RNA helicase
MAVGEPGPVAPGLYEELITSQLERRLGQVLAGHATTISALDPAEAADRLAMHLAGLVEAAVAHLPAGDRAAKGAEIARDVGLRLAELVPDAVGESDLLSAGGGVLRAVAPLDPAGKPVRISQPQIPLLDTALLSNAHGEPVLSQQLASEIPSADGIDIIVAFIRFSGLRPMLEALRRHTSDGRRLRVLTTTFTGTTEARALDALADIGAHVRVSYDTSGTRLHAKAWLFHRDSGASTAYIGSSNLTHHAQVLGQEWNVRVSGRRNPGVLDKMAATFEGAWENGDFVDYDPGQFAEAMANDRAAKERGYYLPPVEVRLDPFQDRLLERIELSRAEGRHRNLLVAATGTGKTVMAAVDYARLRRRLPRARLLFVAHREEILDQSLATFRYVLREPAFGEKWVGGARPREFEHVFASIQSITAAGLEAMDPRHFDVVIVDEFHHAAARSYEALLAHLQPAEMLGLTATPERADGMPILHWFDDRIAAELRLWDAIDQGRLVPFHYYGLHDGLDLRDVPWRRGRGYDTEKLANVMTADDAWARRVIHQVHQHIGDPATMRALGFCVSVSHAHFMAAHFNSAGIRSVAVTGNTPDAERRAAIDDLRSGKFQAVFSVDLFNEGVDVPTVDTIIMLRPTDSATVFLQQLGRGLRKSRDGGKSVCVVLDFIGLQNREFRFDRKLGALVGGTRRHIEQQVQQEFPYLPAGCHLALDREAQEIVLRSIKEALPSTWPQLQAELRNQLAAGVEPTLANFLHHSGLDLEDVVTEKRCWSDLKESVGLTENVGPHEAVLRRGMGRMLHIDDTERLDAYAGFAANPSAPEPQSPHERALLRMLVVSLARTGLSDQDIHGAARLVWEHPQVLAELREVLALLRQRVDHLHTGLANRPEVPLQIHARYTRDEILSAFGVGLPKAKPHSWQSGVLWVPEQQADLFAVTLVKSDHFSPTTRYRDYAVNRTLFHWESQSATRADSPTGRRYREHAGRGSDVLLFVREHRDERSFWFLGPATYVRHEGERPMAILWELAHALPGDLYADFAAAAVA